jgi:hypothetical protein
MEFYKLLADDELLAIFNHFIELLWAFIAQRCQFQKKTWKDLISKFKWFWSTKHEWMIPTVFPKKYT